MASNTALSVQLNELVAAIPKRKNDPTFWLILADCYEENGFERSEAGRRWLEAFGRIAIEDGACRLGEGFTASYDWRGGVASTESITKDFPYRLPESLFVMLRHRYNGQSGVYYTEFPSREEGIDALAPLVVEWLAKKGRGP